jgi:beta-lactam-binding protein with PASTA domain
MEQKYRGKVVTKGMKIPINSIIEFVVGQKTGAEFAYVPDLNGLTINEAEERLRGAGGLRLFAIYNDCASNQDSLMASITNQTPVAGDSSKVPYGSTITVFASPTPQVD